MREHPHLVPLPCSAPVACSAPHRVIFCPTQERLQAHRGHFLPPTAEINTDALVSHIPFPPLLGFSTLLSIFCFGYSCKDFDTSHFLFFYIYRLFFLLGEKKKLTIYYFQRKTFSLMPYLFTKKKSPVIENRMYATPL